MIGVFAIWQQAKPAILRCFDQDRRHSSLAHYTVISRTTERTSISCVRRLPSRRTSQAILRYGKTVSTSAKLVENVGRHMVSLVQQTPSSQAMGRIRQLEQENALLRASQLEPGMNGTEYPEESQPFEPPGDEPGTIIPLRRPDRDMPPPLHSPLTHIAPRVEPKNLTPTPPTKPIQKTLLFGKPDPSTDQQTSPQWLTFAAGKRWTKRSHYSISEPMDEDQDPGLQDSCQVGPIREQSAPTDATCTSWTTSQCHSVPSRVGHGAGSSSQIQRQGSHQVAGYFRWTSEMSMHEMPKCLHVSHHDVCSIVSAHGWPIVEAHFSITLVHVFYVSMSYLNISLHRYGFTLFMPRIRHFLHI